MNHTSDRKPPVNGVSFPWALFLLGLGTILINAGFLAACWRMMHLSQKQQLQTASETRKFHLQLLGELKQIASQTPVSATEDLCQVRFRLRFPDGIESPLTPIEVQLLQRSKEGSEEFRELQYRTANQPVLNFGFLPPGEYRLCLKNALDMRCQHDFRVFPGIPVDRVASCPRPEAWHQRQPPFSLRVHSVWPIEWDSEPIIAVYHLEAGLSRVEGWEWQVPEARRFHQWVVAGNLRGPFSEKAFWRTVPESLFAHPIPPELAVLPDKAISLPYGRCELTAISFVLDKTLEQQGYVYLGTCRFAGKTSLPGAGKTLADGNLTFVPQEAPWWDIDSQPAAGFPIAIPRLMIRQVAERAKVKSQADSATVSGLPEEETPARPGKPLDSIAAPPSNGSFTASPVTL